MTHIQTVISLHPLDYPLDYPLDCPLDPTSPPQTLPNQKRMHGGASVGNAQGGELPFDGTDQNSFQLKLSAAVMQAGTVRIISCFPLHAASHTVSAPTHHL